jgi:hypothetical protein
MGNILQKGSKVTDVGIQMPGNAASLGSMKKRRLLTDATAVILSQVAIRTASRLTFLVKGRSPLHSQFLKARIPRTKRGFQ